MADAKNLNAVLKAEADKTKATQAKEEAAAAAKPVPRGKVLVRLVRPFYDENGVLHKAGIHKLDAGSVPSSAKVLKAEAPPVEVKDGDGDDN